MAQFKPHPKAFTIASLLAYHGWKRGSLSGSGAAGAWVVGYLHMANDNPVFGVGLISFYALGTLATKYKASKKFELEFDPSSTATRTTTSNTLNGHLKKPSSKPLKPASAGNRTLTQVISTSLPSLLSSLIYRFVLTGERSGRVVGWVGWGRLVSSRLGGGELGEEEVWGRLGRALVFVTLGHLATCLGDTLSSELGILSPQPPYLLTTLKRVPPGTNGAISLIGTAVSAVGGAGLGGVMRVVWGRYLSGVGGLAAGVGADVGTGGVRGVRGVGGLGWWMIVGGMAGLGGSLLDSMLGSTLQKTYYDPAVGKVWTRSPRPPRVMDRDGDGDRDRDDQPEPHLSVVGGWVDMLTNSQVNLLSSAMVSLTLGWLSWTGKA